MSLANALRATRSRVEDGEDLFFALHATVDASQIQSAVDLLTAIFLPTVAQFEAALIRWAYSHSPADEALVVKLCRTPGAQIQFWPWAESKERQPWDILRGLDVAILRAKKM